MGFLNGILIFIFCTVPMMILLLKALRLKGQVARLAREDKEYKHELKKSNLYFCLSFAVIVVYSIVRQTIDLLLQIISRDEFLQSLAFVLPLTVVLIVFYLFPIDIDIKMYKTIYRWCKRNNINPD